MTNRGAIVLPPRTLYKDAGEDSDGVEVAVAGYPQATVQIDGTFGTASLQPEGSLDGENWHRLAMKKIRELSQSENTKDHYQDDISEEGIFVAPTAGVHYFRLKLTNADGDTELTVKATVSPVAV